ncbi:lectin-like protein [Luteolibacter arcticus]|uniref:Lectin-like protein n=1 Tax=Luteolibacter arcticus TaxID=1581411 RepID=A0ABT3GDQ1_9BACT|nr:lectin-like protein [Luteolibacter arcticus]MCW1921742.1 lectin-like protein [Luteolibacter arcticus]
MNRLSLLLTGLALAPAALQAGWPDGTLFTAPFGPGGTWNLYKTVSVPMSWTEAQSAAERSVDPLGKTGKAGHLVCIGSAAENMFVYQKVQGHYIWIGLTDSEKRGAKEAGSDRENGWRWLTGEPSTFSAWRSPEPNEFNAMGEDAVAMESSGRWADWPNGADGQTEARHASMIEWETRSPEPVPGAIKIERVLPEKWSVDFSKGEVLGEGPWSAVSVVGLDTFSIWTMVRDFQAMAPSQGAVHRLSRMNYHVERGSFFAGGWAEIKDNPAFPMIMGPCAALHVAKVKLDKPGTWSINVHGDDYFAVRFPGHKWKSATGLGGIDPLDAETLYFECESGDGCAIGVIDLPAGESTVEVFLGNRIFDGMIQMLAAPGEHTLDGSTDQWRVPGHKAAGDLAWPGVGSKGWAVIRRDLPAGAKPMEFLKDGMSLPDSAPAVTVEGVEKINYIDSGAASDVEFPNPVELPGDAPGGQNQFVVMAQAELVIPRDGLYHIGIHSDNRAALRIADQKWLRFVRDTTYRGQIEGDTMHTEDPDRMGTYGQLFGEVELKKGTYTIEAFYVNTKGPTALSVFGAPAGFAPRLLVKDGGKIEPDIDGMPLVMPAPAK